MLIACRLTIVLAVLATSVLSMVGRVSAGRIDPPGHQDGNHCVNAFGVDLNDLYGVPEQFRMFDCRVISAGEHWIRPIWWITNTAADSVYPAGYFPAKAAPLDDLVSKLKSIEVVVDGGTHHERTYVLSPSGIVRTDINAEQLEPGSWGAPYPMTTILPRLGPLSIGEHFIEVFLVLGAEHCDGFTTDPDLSCLPAGETQFVGHPVVFTRPEH
jgi:hypothetical protein